MSSPVVFVCHLLLSSIVFTGDTIVCLLVVLRHLLLLVMVFCLLFWGCFSSPITGDGPLSAVSGRLLSPITSSSSLSAISGRLSLPVTRGGPLSTVSSRPSSFVTGDSLLSFISVGSSLAFMAPTGSRALFLTSIPSCVRCSSLPSLPLFHFSLPFLPISLTCNPTPLTGKRLFD